MPSDAATIEANLTALTNDLATLEADWRGLVDALDLLRFPVVDRGLPLRRFEAFEVGLERLQHLAVAGAERGSRSLPARWQALADWQRGQREDHETSNATQSNTAPVVRLPSNCSPAHRVSSGVLAATVSTRSRDSPCAARAGA